jgi:Transposase, Mutator family
MLSIVVDEDRPRLELDLDALVREGARRMLVSALKAEVDAYIEAHAGERDAKGHAPVVRNGVAQPRKVTTAAGELEVQAPRVNDRREGSRFTSAILPPWARRSPKVTEVLPVLYLRGISTKDFVPTLAEFFGTEAGLSASTVQRLTREWSQEWKAFNRRDLSHVDYVYLWADGVHFNIRLEEDRLCCLILVGVRADGRKELVAVGDGYRESEEYWAEVLRDLKRRGMRAPVLALGDGALGFWGALREVFRETKAAALLGAQDRERPGCAAKEPAAQGQGGAARDHERGEQGGRRGRRRPLPGVLRGQVPEGGREAAQGPGGAAHPLRVPGRALDPPGDHQRHRVHLRHRPAADQEDQGRRQPERRAGDGLQAAGGSPGSLALRQRIPPGRARSRWRDLRERGQGRARRPQERRVIATGQSATIHTPPADFRTAPG